MFKYITAIAVVGCICAAASGISSARAMPVADLGVGSETPNVTRVWDDCGHGLYRDQYGRCVSNWQPGPNGCPPGYHLGWDVRICIRNP